LAATVVSLVAIGVGGFLYFTKLEMPAAQKQTPPAGKVVAVTPSQPANAAPSPGPSPSQSASPPPSVPAGDKLVPGTVPFIGERTRLSLANEYHQGAGYKAFALNLSGVSSFVLGQRSEDAAKGAALDQCQQRANVTPLPRQCELYAVGNSVIYPHGPPPVAPLPWIKRDTATERPFAAKEMPLVRDPGRERLDKVYAPGRKSKTIALGSGGQFIFNTGGETIQESARRSLESCGALAGVVCTVVAADDLFVVPVPTTMKVIGFFRPANNASIAADARDGVARKLEDTRPRSARRADRAWG
jgi:hypothetical protein